MQELIIEIPATNIDFEKLYESITSNLDNVSQEEYDFIESILFNLMIKQQMGTL